MRVLVNIRFSTEPFNTMNREVTAGLAIKAILDEPKPEAAYFYDPDGCQGCMIVVHLDDPSRLPSVAELFFMKFQARCDFHIAMSPADLENAGLEGLGRKWG
jgi:hypothetical protein